MGMRIEIYIENRIEIFYLQKRKYLIEIEGLGIKVPMCFDINFACFHND